MVRSAARELAGDRQSGMRLHVPGHLEPNFKALERLSYALKQRFQTLKRNIKFDDANMDLRLDFQTDPQSEWRIVLPEQAKKHAAAPAAGVSSDRSMSYGDITALLENIPVASD